MLNYVQRGEVVTRIAPPGGCRAGVPVVYGDEIVVPITDASEGEPVACLKRGVVVLPTQDSFSVGMLAYWDATNARVVATPSEYVRILGYAQGSSQYGVVVVSLLGYNPPGVSGLVGVYGTNGISGGGTTGTVYLSIDSSVVVTKSELGDPGGAGLVGIADAGSYYDGTTVEAALEQIGPLASLEVVEVVIEASQSSGSAALPQGYNTLLSVIPKGGLESYIKNVFISDGSVTVELGAAQGSNATVQVYVARVQE